MKIMPGSMRRHYVAIVSVFLVTVVLIIAGMASSYHEIRTWYDLDAIRDDLGGHHILMNDLDSTTPGYEEVASPTANQGKGWDPIGFHVVVDGGGDFDLVFPMNVIVIWHIYTGTLDGQGYEIRDLFINRPDEYNVGLFYILGDEGVIKDLDVLSITVIGRGGVGSLVGSNRGTVSNSYSTGNVSGSSSVGGLVGSNLGTMSNSCFTGNVTGTSHVGGLAGGIWGTVSNSHSTGTVTGEKWVGGLVGDSYRSTVSNSSFSGSVTGSESVGGLVGNNGHASIVSNSYSTGSVTGYKRIGGLVGSNVGTVSYSYSSASVTGLGADTGSYLRATHSGIPEPVGYVGGLVGDWLGWKWGTESYSFWDTETSGQATSDGPGTGKTTAEMMDIATFSGSGWDITAVADPGTCDPAYIWNIVNGATYPFLSCEP